MDAGAEAPAAGSLAGAVDGKYRPAPLPLHYVARPRLSAALDAIPPGGVGLVIGPAGTGKTTAMRAWLDTSTARSVWLGLDVLDGDHDRFWRSSAGATARLAPASGAAIIDAVEAGRDVGADDLLGLFERLAAAREPLLLLIDDLDFGAIERRDSWLMTRLPSNLRVAVTARREPPWPLARMRAAGLLTEIRYDDLLFDEAEAGELLTRLLGEPADDAVRRSLMELTEGWISPLVVAGRYLGHPGRGAADLEDRLAGAASDIAELLEAEVLAVEDPAVVDLLVETSPLDVLEPEVCAAVGERVDALDLLHVAQEHQLVQRGGGPQVWRVPRPLRDALRARLRARPLHEQRVHRRAARWFGATGPPEAAAQHAMACLDPQLSRDLFVANGPVLLGRGAPRLVVAWGRSLADDVLDVDPKRRLDVAWILGLAGASSDAAAHIARAAPDAVTTCPELLTCLHWWTAVGTGDLELADRLAAQLDGCDATHPAFGIRWLALAHALLCAGQLEAAAAVIDDGIRDPLGGRLVPDHARLAMLAELAWLQGDLAGARQHADAALESWRVDGVPHGRASLPALRAKAGLALEAGDLAAAAEILDDVDRLVEHAEPTVLVAVAAVVARSAYLRAADRADEARNLIEQTRRRWDSSPGPRVGETLAALLAAEEVRVCLDLGDADAASRACAAARSRPEANLLVARTRLAMGDAEGAAHALAGSRPVHPRAELEALLLGARAASDADTATRLCEEAVQLGVAHGFLRCLVDERALHGIYVALYRTAPSRAIAAVMADLDGKAGVQTGDETIVTGPNEHLTHREVDVLRLLPSHLSNQEIAGELDVSLNTAKTHLKSLYRKLGVDTRSAAVDHGRRLGLIR